MASTDQSKILAGIFSLDILYVEGKSLLLMSNIQFNFGDILPETSKSSAFWDMGVDSHLKWLFLFSADVAGKSGRHQSTKKYCVNRGSKSQDAYFQLPKYNQEGYSHDSPGFIKSTQG